ncbi:hypothetical protein KDA_26300 [Dictyobacter alpinus]|uniref:Uncharacterized protein n=1 Tax=Dictyobacter alpinus TaxID=2014873 RepID=A0A402B730_9CHLR|nr:hypothetical protein [Dictyobacter alpinus]GCE27146.1 hypothetical protein KDA_26300 [Dictyobacter alpinus]
MDPIFADLVIFTFGLRNIHFTLSVGQVLCWVLAVVVGSCARLIFGRRVAFGIFGTIVVALIGIWFATDVILINVPQDILIYDVPLFKALAGALIFEVLWYLIAYRSYRLWSRRRRLYASATPTPTAEP